ncbi:MAG: hypothetical protein D6824_05725 [Planctomycetota bacterium]|nr:MAG: hypothetical protein D6824_05725 [Planctomycetota bacterium]
MNAPSPCAPAAVHEASPTTRPDHVESAPLFAAAVAALLGFAAPPATLVLIAALPKAWAAHLAALAWGAVACAAVVGVVVLVEGLQRRRQRALRCTRCRYDVAILMEKATSPRCPECGAALHRPGAVAVSGSRDRRRVALGAATLLLGVGPTLAAHAHASVERTIVALLAQPGASAAVEHPLAPRAFRQAPTPAPPAP